MSIVFKVVKLITPRLMARPPATPAFRGFADKVKTPSSKHVVGTQKEERVRVRRARAADTPRVLRFVREHARLAWPALEQAPHNVVLGDFVARTLAQGHSMLAEQQESKRSFGAIRGVALSAAVCPWDAALLEGWARCLRCPASKHLMLFTAHCLRAPGLHDKYNVHAVMQVVLMVPPDDPKAAEIARLLAKNALNRSRDGGFPVLRFDITSDFLERSLQDFNLQKEWEFYYEVHPNSIKECVQETLREDKSGSSPDVKRNHVAVYTAFPLRK